MAAPRTGGPPVLLATQGSGHGTVVLADDAHVYWGQFYGRVARVPKAGGAVEEVANLVRTFALAQDDEYLYAADYDPEGAVHVVRIPKAGGPPQALARTSRSADIRGIAVDDEHVYWTDASARALWRAPKR